MKMFIFFHTVVQVGLEQVLVLVLVQEQVLAPPVRWAVASVLEPAAHSLQAAL